MHHGVALRHVASGTAVAAMLLLLTSCPNPFTLQLMRQALDQDGPVITLTSVLDSSVYGSTVLLAGSATDTEGGRASSLSIEIPIAQLVEAIALADDGTFSYTLSTAGISQTLTVTLTASDWSGNTAERTVTLFNDARGPWVEIAEPVDMSYYSSVVRVSGRITDGEGLETTTEVKSASYAVSGTSVGGTLDLGADGAFTVEFQTKSPIGEQLIDGPRSIEVTAEDWNLNLTTSSVMVLRPSTGSDVATFDVAPDNGRVTISWEPVLHATGYVIHSPRYGQKRTVESSPYVWDGLANGALYSFQLQALIPEEDGADAWSDLQDVIPLSEQTLAPWVREVGYRTIAVEWRPLAAEGEYVVERRSAGGVWEVRSIGSATALVDEGLEHDTWYAYRVLPATQAAISSAEVWAVPGRFPAGGAEEVGARDTPGYANTVALQDGWAYVADGPGGLRVMDVSDPTAPVLVATAADTMLSRDVVVLGARAYVAASGDGVLVYDVSDPTSPSLLNTYPTIDAYALAVEGTTVYVADASGGMLIVDFGNPAAPIEVGAWASAAYTYDVAVAEGYAYLAEEADGLSILSLADPAHPTRVGHCMEGWYAYALVVVGSHVYVAAEGDGIRVIDAGTITAPAEVGWADTPGDSYGIATEGGLAYITASGDGLQVFDVSTPETPTLVSSCDTPGTAYGVAVAGGYAYVADNTAGLRILDVSLPLPVEGIGAHDTDGWAQAVTVVGSSAYVSDHYGGLRIFDVTDPLSPVPAGGWENGFAVIQTVVVGTQAYVACSDAGLQILDVSDPLHPVLVGGYDTAGYCRAVAIAGPLACLADGDSGLQVIDVSDPTEPLLLGVCDTAGYAMGVAVAGNHAYVADNENGLVVVDISNPATPVAVATYPAGARYFYAVVVAGGYAYIAETGGDLVTVDVSTPSAPAAGGTLALTGPRGLALDGACAYIADGSSLRVVDISNPMLPRLVATHATPSTATGAFVAGSRVYVSDWHNGLRILGLGPQ